MNPYLTNKDLMLGKEHMDAKMDKMMKSVMSNLGKRGTGKAKVRGNSAYYKRMVKIREEKRRENEKSFKNASEIQTKAKPLGG